MAGFRKKIGWLVVFAIEAWALLLGLAWTGNISVLTAAVSAACSLILCLMLVSIWYISLPDRCRVCQVIYNRYDHFTNSPGFTVASLAAGRKIDLTVCTKCAVAPVLASTNDE